jgi:hypothetical protein
MAAGRFKEQLGIASPRTPHQHASHRTEAASRLSALNSEVAKLLSDRGRSNTSTWARLGLQLTHLIDNLGSPNRTPELDNAVQDGMGNCLATARDWQDNHKEPLLLGKDTWQQKSGTLDRLIPILSKPEDLPGTASTRGSAITTTRGSATTREDASNTPAANASLSPVEEALKAEKSQFVNTKTAILLDIGRGNTLNGEVLRVSTSAHLADYAQKLTLLGHAIVNYRASMTQVSEEARKMSASGIHLAGTRAKELGDLCKEHNWYWPIPENNRMVDADAARKHIQRVADIRSQFSDFEQLIKPRASLTLNATDLAEEWVGSPLSCFFG